MTLRDDLAAGHELYGLVSRISDPSVCEAIGGAGFDFVMIDCEHAPFSWHDVQSRVVAAQAAGLQALVRLSSFQPGDIGLALDLGADGVHVPHVQSLAQATSACDSALYAPMGKRGFALSHRGARYGRLAAADAIAVQNQTTVVLHIEDVAGVEAIDEIARETRAGVLFVAPFDLSYGLGVPGDLNAEVLWAALRRVAQAASQAGLVCGTYVSDHGRVPELREMGYRYLLVGGDLGLLSTAAADIARRLGKHGGGVTPGARDAADR